MADTTFIKKEIEPCVRGWLAKQFTGHRFCEKPIALTTGRRHEFDAVSEDDTIVGDILSSRAQTRTGNENTGGVRKALLDLLYLNLLPPNVQRVLVFTDDGFRKLIKKRIKGLEVHPICMLLCPLPDALQDELKKVLNKASHLQRAVGEG